MITFLKTLVGGETTASSSYVSRRLRIRAFHVFLEQISGLVDVFHGWHFCDDAGCTSARTGRRVGPPRVPSKQDGTVAEEANEKVHPASAKGLEARRALGLAIRRSYASGYPAYM